MSSQRPCPKCKGQKLLSTTFGDSPVIIEACLNCRGIWLDQDELQQIMDSLRTKLDKLSSDEMKRKVREEINEIRGGPEDTVSEILDAKAIISALINIRIFEHPALFRILELADRARIRLGL